MKRARIILLNGASSSGKSAIAVELQRLFKDPYMHLGIDTVFSMIPSKCKRKDPRRLMAFVWQPIHGEAPEVMISVGTLGHRIMSGFHHACAAMCRSGLDLVIDHVLMDKAWARECKALFSPFEYYFVGVLCPIDVLERREQERGDRQIGLTRFTALHAHSGNEYDMTVNSAAFSARECAEQIIQHVSAGRSSGLIPRASFRRHWMEKASQGALRH
ncbi:MAG: chloramphenicol phosphotransferase [Deltaproteobacteria bacterium]|nr:chloramphenicol phosphotransferase [Deltaproteobacteria bacterium]